MKDAIQQVLEKGRPPARQPSGREALLEAISKEEALLARLDREQADARERLAALQAELSSLGTEPETPARSRASRSSSTAAGTQTRRQVRRGFA